MQTPARLWSVLAALAKTALGVAIFVSTVAGWAYFKPIVVNRLPLPDSVPESRNDRCAVWFVGSSSIERWRTIERDMHGWQAHRRGIGGAMIDQIAARSLRTGATHPPAGIVFYAGENDIDHGMPSGEAAQQMLALVEAMTARWRGVPIFVLGLKPSPVRWSQRAEQLRFGAIIERYAETHRNVTFVPVGARLMRGGLPDPALYVDGVHLTDRGYGIWSTDVLAGIDHGMPPATMRSCAPQPPVGRDPRA